MLNFLVETKNEYTTHLINILTPLIFEGLQSVYKDARKTACDDDVLKVFQSFLRQIPKWNEEMVNRETERIINSSQSYAWLNDLMKATLKSNLVILMYNPTAKKQNKIDPAYYQDIKATSFIHKIYIECARELWNNPYLLYHEYPPLEIKRNQRDCLAIIKDCIKEAIRKLLPVKHILQIYLGEDIELNNMDEEVDKVMSDHEKTNLGKMIKQDLAQDPFQENEYKSPTAPHVMSQHKEPTIDKPMLIGGKKSSTNSEEKTIGSRILNIINEKKDSITSSDVFSASSSSIGKEFEAALNPPKNVTSNNINNNTNNVTSNNLDQKLKTILKKDLATDSDLETSLNYSQEDNNDKYQEIFSNSNVEKTKDNAKDKKKFFNNFMQF
jgi:hypothetical protein